MSYGYVFQPSALIFDSLLFTDVRKPFCSFYAFNTFDPVNSVDDDCRQASRDGFLVLTSFIFIV